MKPEKWDTGPNKQEYLALNIPDNWINHYMRVVILQVR